MSRIVGRCRYCQKTIRDRPFIGTLHVCLTEFECRQIDTQLAMAQQQMAAQARATYGGTDWGLASDLFKSLHRRRGRVAWPASAWVRV